MDVTTFIFRAELAYKLFMTQFLLLNRRINFIHKLRVAH